MKKETSIYNHIYNKVYIYNKVKRYGSKSCALHLFVYLHQLSSSLRSILRCSDNSISTRYPCQFIFRTIYHPGSTIENALQGAGTYTMVSAKKVNGAWNLYSTPNDGKNHTETIVLSTAKENYANYSYLGAGNDLKDATKNGFILGPSNFNGYVAWDRQCLNCILQYGGTNYPLEWTGNRQSVICNKCKRVYSLENGTVTSGGKTKEDKTLMQYRVTYTGHRKCDYSRKLKDFHAIFRKNATYYEEKMRVFS